MLGTQVSLDEYGIDGVGSISGYTYVLNLQMKHIH